MYIRMAWASGGFFSSVLFSAFGFPDHFPTISTPLFSENPLVTLIDTRRPSYGELITAICCYTTGISTRSSLSSPRSEAMSLACLACHGVDSSSESFRRYSTSDSDGEGRCGARMNCWSRKTPVAPPPEITNSIMSSRVAPQPAVTSQGSPGSPRLMRCHAVRRDIFRDWHFDETIEEGQQLWQ